MVRCRYSQLAGGGPVMTAPINTSNPDAGNEVSLHIVVAGQVIARITIPESASIRRAASVALQGEPS